MRRDKGQAAITHLRLTAEGAENAEEVMETMEWGFHDNSSSKHKPDVPVRHISDYGAVETV
jgi:hypothetical protein